ncbi:M20/M25/M40 family metallo-hydrolase [Pseudonocardia pini]|uniref:M20/M25/M40 family metallo-hydrolase n=1 Tax=Pseudonocardia pini TaxID=2758030 RepID=UPI0015F0ADCC|nr:M20/M25/M40 family metallo-hydrolase [Pseudonocardia pini]
MRTTLVALFAGLTLACTTAAPTVAPSPYADTLVATASGDGTFAQLSELDRVTRANGGNRATGEPGYDAAVDHVVAVLQKAGWRVTTPEFTLGDRRYRNVVAQSATGAPDRVVMAGAHLDSVPEGPGINDNGSGVATLLEIATRMGGSPPVAGAVRLAFWGAEEIDFEGSQGYVDALAPAEREAIDLYLNVDMTASPNPGYFVQGRGDDLAARLTALGAVPDRLDFDGTSDYAPFVDAGIPSAGLLAGDAEEKSADQAERWGGTAGEVFDRCYHTACDDLDNIDRTALDRFTDAVAGSLAALSTG